MLQPVALTNCQLERFGEAHDGGYLMCGNLLGGVQSGYSYGISGYDKWGCDISTKFDADRSTNTTASTRPSRHAPSGETVFHAECVGDTTETIEGRAFDTIDEPVCEERRQLEAHRAEDRRRGRGMGLASVRA